jgi:hypothetical protein
MDSKIGINSGSIDGTERLEEPEVSDKTAGVMKCIPHSV